MRKSFIQENKRDRMLGLGLGAAVFAVCSIWFSWKIGLLLGVLIALTGFVKFRFEHPLSCFAMNAFWGIVCIFFSCCIPTILVAEVPEDSFLLRGSYRIAMNFLCVAGVYGILLVLTGKIKSAVVIASGLLLLLATVNMFILRFRGSELKPTDFLSVGTALNVADQYVFRVESTMAYGWFVWLWMNFALRSMPEEKKLIPGIWLRLAAAVASVACFAVLWQGMDIIPLCNWYNQGTVRNGYYLNFAIGLKTSIIREPDNYSEEMIQMLESEYTDAEISADAEDLPNIIVIMSEAFADVRVLGSEPNTGEEITPFIDSLTENTIRGYALSSVYGGNTANSEYEFLTGNSMAWLPTGSVPYQQYVNGESDSLANLMGSYGYTTMATHPYLSNGWHRTKVYPAFGFETMTFQEDYPGQDILRDYISDQEFSEYILNALKNKEDGPMFLFGISMQNHGDYIYQGPYFEQTIRLDGYQYHYNQAEQYLSLLQRTDKATEYLLTQLEAYPEETIVVFFGDHFPRLEPEFYEELYGGSFDTLSEQMLQYKIPFFIWANYDIPEQTVECTSLNYLGRYLLETAGISLPPYYQFLKELETVIPSINASGYYSVSQQTYLPLEEATGEEAQWLNRYEILQYNGMFDEDARSQVFFGQYGD